MSGILSIIATPIGNLEDITLRALRVLKEADVIYAEDTRVIGKLLAHYQIQTSVQRLDAATESKKIHEILERLDAGEHVAYVSDAGTPGISDPGARLVAAARFAGCRIDAIPGPSAITALISIAGLTSDTFTFLGFLPHKKGRQTMLKEIAVSAYPVIVYESPHRIEKLLTELGEFEHIPHIILGRELTKMFEEVVTGTPQEVLASLQSRSAIRGEFVVIIQQHEDC